LKVDYDILKRERDTAKRALEEEKRLHLETSSELRRTQERLNLLLSKFNTKSLELSTLQEQLSKAEVQAKWRESLLIEMSARRQLLIKAGKQAELQEPLFKVGVAIRLRFWEQAKKLYTWPSTCTCFLVVGSFRI
jgi:hypothetical protein